MSELITDAEIADGMNAAYVKAGHNAYFGEGFRAGVEFALENSKANEMVEMLKKLKKHPCLFKHNREEIEQLIQQATTIK